MTDNVAISPGVGAVISTDDIGGGVQVQRVKIQQGADGSATDVSSSAPLQVTLANTGTNATAVKVDGSAVTQPVSDASGSLTVDAPVATPVFVRLSDGTSAIATLPVSAASLPLPTGAATAAKQPALGTAGSASTDVITVQGIASGTAQPVSIATAPVLVAGSAVIGKVGIDQTTPGTTNLVALAANQTVNVAQINGATPLMGAGNTGTGSPRVTISTDQAALAAAGQGATGSAVPAGAQYRGGLAKTALPTAASDGNLTGAMSDKFGRQVNILGTIRDLVGTQTTTLSASTSETTIATAVASTFLDLVLLVISNTSSATNTRIDFRDTTAGSVLFSLQSNGGQPPIGFSTSRPIPQTSVNTNWTAQCATSTTDVRVYAVFEKNK